MTKLIKKMENCSESSFILFEKTSPVESPLWTERLGRPPVGWCPISNGDKPTKKDFLLGFEKCGVATRKCFGIT